MTIQDVVNTVDYIGDGAQTSFAFNFYARDVAWVQLDFTDDVSGVVLNIDQDINPGGAVEYFVAPPNLQELRIERLTPITQETDYERHDPFDSMTNEDNLDKLTAIIQDVNNRLSGAVDLAQAALDQLWQFADFGADRTLQIFDKSKMLRSTGTAPTPAIQLITVPLDSNINHEIGTQISVVQKGTAQVDWIGEGGVVVNSAAGASIARRYGTVTFIKEGINEWMVVGEVVNT